MKTIGSSPKPSTSIFYFENKFNGITHRPPFLHTNIRITNTIIIKFTSVHIPLNNNNNNKNFNKNI